MFKINVSEEVIMEGSHHHQPEGDRNEITADDELIIYEPHTPTNPPITFTEAASQSPYDLLRELEDHALHRFEVEQERDDPKLHLAELALSSAVIWWWNHWQPIMMHRALKTGASLAEVAAAAGSSEAEVYRRWLVWADDQSRLTTINGRPALNPAEVQAIRERLGLTS